jgi:hypothetical protein
MASDVLEAFWEADGLENSEDPAWFQFVLQDMYHVYTPLVLSPRFYAFIQRQKKLFTIKNGRLHRQITRNNHCFLAQYVPQLNRKDILERFHLTLGPLSTASMFPLIETRYYWPNLEASCKLFVQRCNICQLQANSPSPARPLHPHAPIGLPFFKWVNFIQNLPESTNGYRHIITAIDYATKYVVAKAVHTMDAHTVATFLFENIFCVFGAPIEIVSDRGSFLTTCTHSSNGPCIQPIGIKLHLHGIHGAISLLALHLD